MNNAYILNKSSEEIIFNIHAQIQATFLQAVNKEFFQSQAMEITPDNRERLVKIVVSICSKFVATEIKHVAGIQGIDKNKVREMFFTCIEKFLEEFRF